MFSRTHMGLNCIDFNNLFARRIGTSQLIENQMVNAFTKL
jgi:hypothetical protein